MDGKERRKRAADEYFITALRIIATANSSALGQRAAAAHLSRGSPDASSSLLATSVFLFSSGLATGGLGDLAKLRRAGDQHRVVLKEDVDPEFHQRVSRRSRASSRSPVSVMRRPARKARNAAAALRRRIARGTLNTMRCEPSIMKSRR